MVFCNGVVVWVVKSALVCHPCLITLHTSTFFSGATRGVMIVWYCRILLPPSVSNWTRLTQPNGLEPQVGRILTLVVLWSVNSYYLFGIFRFRGKAKLSAGAMSWPKATISLFRSQGCSWLTTLTSTSHIFLYVSRSYYFLHFPRTIIKVCTLVKEVLLLLCVTDRSLVCSFYSHFSGERIWQQAGIF